jgi:energy-coupling factor transporter ATP-binding protein EcfA2
LAVKIKDLVEIVPPRQPDSSSAGGREDKLASLLLTYEFGDALTRVTTRAAGADRGLRNSLIVGSSGSGKSTLLNAVSSLLALPPDARLSHQRLDEIRALVASARVLTIQVPHPTDEPSLSKALERAVLGAASSEGWIFGELRRPVVRVEALERVIAGMRSGQRLLIAIDDLDEWLHSAGRYAFENLQTLLYLGLLSRNEPISTCAVAGGGMLLDDANAAEGGGWMASLNEDFQIEYLPAHIVRVATASQVLRKSARQRRDILEVLGTLREKLPYVDYSDRDFVDLYPLEASTWAVGSHLHRWLPDFSFPEFAARAAESVRNRPSSSLFALNDMFAACEPQLRRVDALEPIFAVYDRLLAEAVPAVGHSQRLWATFALQSLFMHSLADITVDVITLTNSVLIYSLHGTGSSYTFMAAVLKQLESLARGEIIANGEGTARRYSLVTGQREVSLARVETEADAIDDENEVAWALLGFGGRTFADWPLDLARPTATASPAWDVAQHDNAVTLRPAGSTDGGPRLVILAPGRPWSDARDIVSTMPDAACWIGAAMTPTAQQTIKRWIAVNRLADEERYGRFPDVDSVRREVEDEAAEVFSRVYVERGTLVTAAGSEQVEALVGDSRDENLVARFLPAEASSGEGVGSRTDAAEVRWLAELTAPTRDDVDAYAAARDVATWQKRLESWFAAGARRALTLPPSELGPKAGVTEAVEAYEAKQKYDVALFSVRRALASSSLEGLGGTIAEIFETADDLWATRERLDWLESYVTWLEEVERARKYLAETEPVDDADLAMVRRDLLDWIGRPGAFVDVRRRAAFSDTFGAFRDEYAAEYIARHEGAVGPEVIDRLCTTIVESHAWRALETLTSLPIGDPSRLIDATDLVSQLRGARCDADPRAALATMPRCSCGFRFADRPRLAELGEGAAEQIQAGILQHRGQLQARRAELRTKIKARKEALDPATIRTIAALTGDEDLPEIDDAAAAALAELLSSRPS